MALTSPGVEVTVIDESNYLPSVASSVPLIVIATAQNKVSGAGTGIAAGTIAANVNKPYLITSQRDLTATFGVPFFYKTTAGTPINGYELNEYGLLAAYSVLGVTNRAYIIRSDVDLAELTASLTRPVGAAADGTYWLDLTNTDWGIFEWNLTTGAFTNKVPVLITSTSDLESGVPKQSVGSIGDYAVVTTDANNDTYYKNSDNTWVLVGSDSWKNSWPTIQGTASPSTLTASNTVVINDTAVSVPAAPNNTLAGLASAINSASITGVTADVVSSKLVIYADSEATSDGSTADGGIVNILNGVGTPLTDLGITPGSYYAPVLQQSPHYTVPRWRSTDSQPRATGSIWNKITAVNLGVDMVVKKYSSTLGTWVEQDAPVYQNDWTALKNLDPTGGGQNIAAGATYTQYDADGDTTFTLALFERRATGATIITGNDTSPTFTSGNQFTIQASSTNSTTLTTSVTATLGGTTASDFVAAVSAANVADVSASIATSGAIVIQHAKGGVIVLDDVGSGTALADAGITTSVTGVRAGTGSIDGALLLSNWIALDYTASVSEPDQDPADGTLWYYSSASTVDIMINDGTGWKGYQNVTNDVRGYDLSLTNATGVIVSATEPTTQNDSSLSPLVDGDLWLDSSDLENYPKLYRYETVDAVQQWVLVDNTDQTTENGILFADARWAGNGTTDPITGDLPSTVDLLTSNYVDLDVPDYTLYPTGMLLFNTRRSGYNVKRYAVNYFNATDYPDDVLPTVKDTWVTASGLKDDGSPYMGHWAQRAIILAAIRSTIDATTELREERNQYNIISTPSYPEVMTNMVALNNDRRNTAFVVGDTPLRLAATGTDIVNWATNNNGAGTANEDGLNVSDPYLAVFYPSAQTNDLSGNTVVVPSSHMMLRTILRSDEISFPWLAPAGTRRGTVDNASAIGYIDATTGEFQQIGLDQGLRDVCYDYQVNPITFIPGVGIVNFGNKTTQGTTSALDRINVARLVVFIRGRLEEIGQQFLFEPNDQITRDEIKNVVESLMNDLVAKRGIYDYLVVCDDTNNTPARIDRNELYIDIAIEPVKAVEFIYIPVRLKNTGEIAAGNVASSAGV